MKRVISLTFSFVIFLQSFSFVLAQTRIETNSMIAPRNVIQVDPDVRATIEQRLETSTATREEMMRLFQQKRVERNKILEQRRELLRESLTEVQNERKRAVVQRMEANMQNINDRWIDKANRVLTRLTMILEKIEVRTDRLEQNSDAEVARVRTAIATAKDAIVAAQEVVNTQAEKVYVFDVQDEATLGRTVSSTIASIRSDINEMMLSVGEAKEAVHNALKALTAALNTVVEETAEPSPTPEL